MWQPRLLYVVHPPQVVIPTLKMEGIEAETWTAKQPKEKKKTYSTELLAFDWSDSSPTQICEDRDEGKSYVGLEV